MLKLWLLPPPSKSSKLYWGAGKSSSDSIRFALFWVILEAKRVDYYCCGCWANELKSNTECCCELVCYCSNELFYWGCESKLKSNPEAAAWLLLAPWLKSNSKKLPALFWAEFLLDWLFPTSSRFVEFCCLLTYSAFFITCCYWDPNCSKNVPPEAGFELSFFLTGL